MAKQCCSANKEKIKTIETNCCSSTTVKQEKSICCSNEQNSINNTITNINDKNTSSCNNSSKKELEEEQEEAHCCSSNEQPSFKELSNSSSSEKMSYRVTGMDCAACAATIEKGLSKLNDIVEVKVNFSTGKMHVAARNANALMPIESEIQKLGYSAEPLNQNKKLKTYTIEGMDCGSCAKSIENHLNTLPSVQNVSVNFSTGKMKIEHAGSVEDIISEVSKIGYKAALPLKKQDEQSPQKHKKEMNSVILYVILMVFLRCFPQFSTRSL